MCSSRGLLDDDNFYQRMSEINQEPVPYFRQLCETQYTTSSRPPSASSQSSDQSHVGGEFEDDVEQIPLNRQVTIKFMSAGKEDTLSVYFGANKQLLSINEHTNEGDIHIDQLY